MLHRAMRLPCALQPIREILTIVLRPASLQKYRDGTRDCHLVPQTESLRRQERWGAVEWGGQKCRLQLRLPAPGLQKRNAVRPEDRVFRTCAPHQIQNVGAAAEDNMLTVVDDLAH